MPDTKITALAAITTVAPSADLFPIVDVSDNSMAASGTTKNITVNQLLGAGGTATLASATITGDLGVGTASPSTKLEVATATANTRLRINSTSVVATEYFRSGTGLWLVGSDSTNAFKIARGSNFGGSADYFSIGSATADCTWFDGAGGTRMTLNSVGLGIGQSPTANLDVQGNASTGANNSITGAITRMRDIYTRFRSNSAGISGDLYAAQLFQGGNAAFEIYTMTSYPLVFGTNATEQARIDASGNFLVGKTSSGNSIAGVNIYKDPTDGGRVYMTRQSGAASQTNVAFFESGGSAVGSISTTNVATAYNTSSDYRLKESVKPISGGLARVNALKPSIYKWKCDGSAGEGFLAHELAEVVPAAVSGEKDAVNADGNIKPQGVDLSKVVPVLVAAIQELTARVQTLEAK